MNSATDILERPTIDDDAAGTPVLAYSYSAPPRRADFRQPYFDETDSDSPSPCPEDREPSAIDRMDRIAADMREPGLSARRFGTLGEAYAAAWFEARGWQTLSRNWRTRFGELDIVMMTPDQLIVFVEVKARRYAKYGMPQEAVTADKQRKLRLAASSWLLDRRNRTPHHGVRFDVMSITLGETQPNVRHIAGAF